MTAQVDPEEEAVPDSSDGGHLSTPLPVSELTADCGRCVGLCCVALPFAVSAEFAVAKAAGEPCPNLAVDHTCGVHDHLREEGFGGCVAYECFGAGQQVTQVVFGGADWRRTPEVAASMFEVFPVVRQIQELLWYLCEAWSFPSSGPVRPELRAAIDELGLLRRGTPASLAATDPSAIRAAVIPLLRRASELARAGAPHADVDLAGADLFGADLRGRDLRGADLRGATLVGADLRGADLRLASVLGADLRGADVRGADLVDVLFLTRSQLEGAGGDAATRLSPSLAAPVHWGQEPGAAPDAAR